MTIVSPIRPADRSASQYLLERYASVELYLSPSNRGAGDNGSLARSDSIVSRLAEAGMVEHIPGIRTNLHLHATLRPDIERLAE
jgi:hypothetical protein